MSKHVPAYTLFIEDPNAPCSALEWFREQTLKPVEEAFHWGAVLLYPSMGEVKLGADGTVDGEQSPVITGACAQDPSRNFLDGWGGSFLPHAT